jgi:hypothetical protein
VYGPVRTVVWQGSAGDCRPYADQVGFPSRNYACGRQQSASGCQRETVKRQWSSTIMIANVAVGIAAACVEVPESATGLDFDVGLEPALKFLRWRHP